MGDLHEPYNSKRMKEAFSKPMDTQMTEKMELLPDDVLLAIVRFTKADPADVTRFLGAVEACGYQITRPVEQPSDEETRTALEILHQHAHPLQDSSYCSVSSLTVADYQKIEAALSRPAPAMREALETIAKQRKLDEPDEDGKLGGDVELAYDAIVQIAREALAETEGK